MHARSYSEKKATFACCGLRAECSSSIFDRSDHLRLVLGYVVRVVTSKVRSQPNDVSNLPELLELFFKFITDADL